MVIDVKRAVRSGHLAPIQLNNNPDEWCVKMARVGTFTDHTFLEMAAKMLNTDIVILPLHAISTGDPFHLISAGLLGDGGRGKYVPIFIGNHETS